MIPAGLSLIPSLSGAYISETGDLWIAPWRGSDGRRLPGGWKKPYVRKDGYNIVMVFGKPHLLHRLIALAYLPNPEGYPVVRHRDDNPSHNEVGNLVWGTHSDNTQDMIARGRARFQRLTHCVNGHDIKDRDTSSNCRQCTKDRRKLGLADDDPRHGTSNGFNNYGCRCQDCTEAESARGKEKYRRLGKTR